MRLFNLASLLVGLAVGPAFSQSGDGERSLTQVTEDVWRYDNASHASMVVVTSEGAVVGDPISADDAAWIETEIENRFDKDIAYVLASHSHGDHASGSEVFADTATIVAHENYQKAVGGGFGPAMSADLTFTEKLTLSYGGKTFELTYIGSGHGDDMVVTIVRPDDVAFVVDVVSPGRLPWRTSTSAIEGMIEQVKMVETLDFAILLPGHARTGTKTDATETREYLEALRDRVQAEIDAGKSDEDIIMSLKMPEYSDWANYEEWLPLNVEEALTALR